MVPETLLRLTRWDNLKILRQRCCLEFLSLAELNLIKEGEVNQIELAGHKKLSIPNKNF